MQFFSWRQRPLTIRNPSRYTLIRGLIEKPRTNTKKGLKNAFLGAITITSDRHQRTIPTLRAFRPLLQYESYGVAYALLIFR